jgi:hypothetical protein
MPRIYRAMKEDGGQPAVGPSARMLGVRVPVDVSADAAGLLQPDPAQGMSVAPSMRQLPVERVPKRLRHLVLGAAGPDADAVWSHGDGLFVESDVTANLVLRPDSTDHGNVGPKAAMQLTDFEAALASTRSGWRRDES